MNLKKKWEKRKKKYLSWLYKCPRARTQELYIKIIANNSTTFPASHLHKRKITNTKGTSSAWHLHVFFKKRRIKQRMWSLNVFLQKSIVTIEQPLPSDISTWKIKYQKSKMYQIVVVEAFLHGINRSFYKKELSTSITWSCTYLIFDIL